MFLVVFVLIWIRLVFILIPLSCPPYSQLGTHNGTLGTQKHPSYKAGFHLFFYCPLTATFGCVYCMHYHIRSDKVRRFIKLKTTPCYMTIEATKEEHQHITVTKDLGNAASQYSPTTK